MFLKVKCRFLMTVFFAVTVAAVTAGCNSYSGRYVFERPLKAPEPFPFRFYLRSINVFAMHSTEELQISPSASDRIKLRDIRFRLLNKYPQYFTDRPENALPIDIELIRLKKEDRIDQSDTVAFSLLTLGAIPGIETYNFAWKVVIKCGNIKAQEKFQLFMQGSYSLGIVGLFMQSHKRFPPLDNHDIHGTGRLNLINPNSDRLLLFFSSIINRFDRDALITYFNSQIRDSITLLE